MPRYLISFPGEAMDVPAAEMPDVDVASHAVVREARDAGVLVFAGGLDEDVAPVTVAAERSVSADTYPQTRDLSGGFTVVDVATREAALEWAAKIAVACRCGQEVREFMAGSAP
ncbi:YciI family protein [Actinotalea sp. Marseille-Q4924]|uniref:YciI family protein n=1 Tax=Actinotalea sp. Marseille-Q4924 TaxID=2866571 RepID=UPI001CE45702|nr:YciI family protein [Actinotalea sp. Marseille-Q4924]